jgi:hypothetical protein
MLPDTFELNRITVPRMGNAAREAIVPVRAAAAVQKVYKGFK